MSSLLLYLDHEILDKGTAFTNISGQLYKVNSPYQGLYAYAAPFKQLVNDVSIAGATIMSGVYLNGTFVTIGQSGLYSINHSQGIAYFTGQLPASTVVSGRYSVKDVNVKITDQQEDKVLFENKFVPALKYNQVTSGLATDVETVPALYLRYDETDAMPAAFGGIKDNKIKIKGLLVTKDEFQKVAACNILKNLVHRIIPYVTGVTPFDFLGNYTGLDYSYSNLLTDPDLNPIILDVKVKDVRFSIIPEFQNMGVKASIVNISVSTFMRPS
jgi:hypothetical protein